MTETLSRSVREIERSGAAEFLSSINRGLEKESLRVSPEGMIAATPHPQALGSSLSHSWITTDYSESLLEFITPVHNDVDTLLKFLADLHVFTYRNLGDEFLWTNSMPCIVHGDESIPIADYGKSNIGFMKHVYRRGLGHRYGRLMQTIAGIHYNYSLPDDFFTAWHDATSDGNQSTHYFNLVRNFHRHCWLVLYLFGSAPAICRTFVEGRHHSLAPFGHNSFYLPYGTTLRMSDLGYQNSAQSNIHVCTNSVSDYVRTLRAATEQNYAPYEKIGVLVDGEYRQLNTNLLQIENEFYTVIRPKRIIRPLERPSEALERRGVEYVEVRSIDLNPFEPVGVDAETIRFMDAFLLYCMLEPSPPISREEEAEIAHNRETAVMRGRDPSTRLFLGGKERSFRQQALELLDGVAEVATMIDQHGTGGHLEGVEIEREKINHPEETPSARIIDEMSGNNEAYFEFAMRKAREHEDFFMSHQLDSGVEQMLTREAEHSRQQTAAMEESDNVPFDRFLSEYFSQ